MRRGGERGISLVEATIVLAAVAILAAAAAPAASRTLDRARLARAVSDAEAIKTAILGFRDDLGFQGFSTDGAVNGPLVEMLVSDGDIPREISATGDARWDDLVQNVPASGLVTDFLERHLVTNNLFGTGAAYSTTGANQWRGAYLDAPINPDPWGNRYAVNTRFMRAPSNTRNDTIVWSAGPDEVIDTAFERDGIFPGGDDIIVVVLRNRNAVVP